MTTETGPSLFDADDALPALPYAGTSGWSGSSTSLDRALTEDENGRTSARQRRVLALLAREGRRGLTSRELSALTNEHHGRASGVLSTLHLAGHVARLTSKRHKCQVYVLPEHVDGRETAAHGRKRKAMTEPQRVTVTSVATYAAAARDRGDTSTPVPLSTLNTLLDLIEQAYGTD